MVGFLSQNTKDRIEAIRRHVRYLWAANAGIPWYTFHDDTHNEAVENMLYQLIPTRRQKRLTEEEWFYLLAAAWLHDLGMMLNLPGEQEVPLEEIRRDHHNRSRRYITRKETRDSLGLSYNEAVLIAEICRYHRKSLDINDCAEEAGTLRMRLLAAYLRLADALHVDATRTDEAMYQLLLATGMPWSSRIHWIKSFWVNAVIPDPRNLSIRVELIDMQPRSARMESLAEWVGDEIREELESVRDVLIRGGITFFLDANTKILELPGTYPFELDLLLSNLEQENLSSASEVADSIIETVIRLTQMGPEAYRRIREYREHLGNLISKRTCHVLVRNLYDEISSAVREKNLDEDARTKIVEQIKTKLESMKEMRQRNLSDLTEYARPFLSDGGSILLFGYSSLVLAALERLPPQVKERTKIYIAEGRGKTQYDHENALIYCDGLRYAISARSIGYPDVAIIPDICAANLMSRQLIDKVVFGANGISPAGDFGHTAGHLPLAESAREHNVPVYVIADTAKFGPFPNECDVERSNEWLSRDPKTLRQLKEHNIKTLNPREDRVSSDCVDMLITEIGAFPPGKIPRTLQERFP